MPDSNPLPSTPPSLRAEVVKAQLSASIKYLRELRIISSDLLDDLLTALLLPRHNEDTLLLQRGTAGSRRRIG